MWRLMDCKIIAGDDVVTTHKPWLCLCYAEEDKIVVRNTINCGNAMGGHSRCIHRHVDIRI